MGRDYRKSLEFFEKTGKNAQPVAWLLAGDIFHNGLAGEKNLKRAKEYYEMVISKGNVHALFKYGAL